MFFFVLNFGPVDQDEQIIKLLVLIKVNKLSTWLNWTSNHNDDVWIGLLKWSKLIYIIKGVFIYYVMQVRVKGEASQSMTHYERKGCKVWPIMMYASFLFQKKNTAKLNMSSAVCASSIKSSSLHVNVVFSVCARMCNAAYFVLSCGILFPV